MDSRQPESPDGRWQYAGSNLKRLKTSGVYYVFWKQHGKQKSHSLKTTDAATARRLRNDYMNQVSALSNAEAAQMSFDDLAKRWIETTRHTLKASSATRLALSVKSVSPFFTDLQIRHITARHCENWLLERGKSVSASTAKKELETMRGVFRYAIGQNLIMRDPSKGIKCPRVRSKRANVPTREQFQSIVATIRSVTAQGKGKDGADLVELLAFSGMRLNEARSLRWRDVSFSSGVFTVTGGEHGTKNHEQRTVPMSTEMRGLLERLKRARGKVTPDAFIVQISSAKKCLATACRHLKLPHTRHHDLRHYFATCAIESGVDVPSVARWMGHKDGGAVLMKTYSHLQQAHSMEQMKRVSFAPVTVTQAA